MVGGGRDAFIGEVHRKVVRARRAGRARGRRPLLDRRTRRAPRRRDLGLAPDRSYGTWQEMLDGELARPEDERIDFVTIVTPNDVHYPVAQGVRRGGLRRRLRQAARAHQRAGRRAGARPSASTGVVFGVTYNYTGYPLVREARDMVAPRRPRHDPQGHRGVQPGLAGDAARAIRATSRPTGAPTRPAPASAGAMGDIGSHAENLATTITRPPDHPHLRRPDDVRARAGAWTTTATCCCASRAASAAC